MDSPHNTQNRSLSASTILRPADPETESEVAVDWSPPGWNDRSDDHLWQSLEDEAISGHLQVTETAGWLPAPVLDLLKLTLKTVLNLVIEKHMYEICEGCQVCHPSQRRHSCLYPPERHYFFRYFDELTKRFWNGHFIDTLLKILRLEGFTPDRVRLMGATEAYLYELREAKDIFQALSEFEDNIVDVKRTFVDQILNENYLLWVESDLSLRPST